jgi:hypothetical protein
LEVGAGLADLNPKSSYPAGACVAGCKAAERPALEAAAINAAIS